MDIRIPNKYAGVSCTAEVDPRLVVLHLVPRIFSEYYLLSLSQSFSGAGFFPKVWDEGSEQWKFASTDPK